MCLSNGSWSDVIPQCQPKQCNRPPVPKHAVISSLNQTFNGTVQFTCQAGYEYRSGDAVLRCEENGQWVAGQAMQCMGKKDFLG